MRGTLRPCSEAGARRASIASSASGAHVSTRAVVVRTATVDAAAAPSAPAAPSTTSVRNGAPPTLAAKAIDVRVDGNQIVRQGHYEASLVQLQVRCQPRHCAISPPLAAANRRHLTTTPWRDSRGARLAWLHRLARRTRGSPASRPCCPRRTEQRCWTWWWSGPGRRACTSHASWPSGGSARPSWVRARAMQPRAPLQAARIHTPSSSRNSHERRALTCAAGPP